MCRYVTLHLQKKVVRKGKPCRRKTVSYLSTGLFTDGFEPLVFPIKTTVLLPGPCEMKADNVILCFILK